MTDSSAHRADPRRQRGLVDLRLEELFGSASRSPVPAPADDPAAWDELDVTDYGGDPVAPGPDRSRPIDLADAHDPAGRSDLAGRSDRGSTVGEVPRSSGTRISRRAGRSVDHLDAFDDEPRDGRPRGRTLWQQTGRVARWRIDPERRGAVAVLGAILVAAVAVGWQAVASRPHSQPVADNMPASVAARSFPGSSGGAAATVNTTNGVGVSATPSAARVVVDVVGRVHRPGLVTLPPGARVADAVRAAGGALAGTNLTSINLARVCVDGEQIAVGVPGALSPTGPSAPAGSSAPAALVNLNSATADQLDALPGVGPVMAQRIIAYRTDHGPFTSVDQLRQVSGIGDAKFADLSPLVTVG